jgi:hypothetical protein
MEQARRSSHDPRAAESGDEHHDRGQAWGGTSVQPRGASHSNARERVTGHHVLGHGAEQPGRANQDEQVLSAFAPKFASTPYM